MVLSVAVLVSVSVLSSSYVCADYIVAEWPPSGKELLTQLTVCSLCNLYICNAFKYFQFWIRRLDFCPDCTISRPLLTFYF